MARRSEHSQEQIKEMILQAAETIVMEEGFVALKVRKIAMEIGYTVGSIYMVFDNMADLIMHIKGRTLDKIIDQLNQAIYGQDAENNIRQLAKSYLLFAQQNYNCWSMIFEHRLTEDDVVPEWYQQKVEQVFGLIETQFKKLSLERTEEQSSLAARALWGGVHGICTLSLTGKLDLVGVTNIEDTVTLLVDNFIKGWKLPQK